MKTMFTVSMHQPSYLVWAPLLEKMHRADLFIYLDDVEYTKKSEISRNRVLTPSGAVWLSIPTNVSQGVPIREVRITDERWRVKHWKTIRHFYAKAPFFGPQEKQSLEELYGLPGCDLLRVNLAFTDWLRVRVGITTPTVLSSSLKVNSRSSQRILDLCLAVGAKCYLSGPGALDYMDLESFEAAGIEVLVQNYHHFPYPQQCCLPEFVPRLSVIDMLLNLGPKCLPEMLRRSEWIRAGTSVEERKVMATA